MDLLEHQGKELFATYGIPVPVGDVAYTVEDAVAAAERVGLPVAVKAQVHAGGRGKAGGVKVANSLASVKEHAANMLGLDIKGHIVRRLWIEQVADIEEEYYVSFSLDRSARQHLGILSAEGGVDIETVAQKTPDAISKLLIDPVDGLSESDCRSWVTDAGIRSSTVDILLALYEVYTKGDADLVEVNPLILTSTGDVVALDAKVTIDLNSVYRHASYVEYDATQPRDHRESVAHSKGLQYVGLEGTVGVIANGAGLSMSTVDLVSEVGGSPANFLDIGGGANAQVMANALEVINDDPDVRSILINVFGGITRCDEVAKGIIQARECVQIKCPMVVRFDGTNVEEGKKLMEPHLGVDLVMASTMFEAARQAVQFASESSERDQL